MNIQVLSTDEMLISRLKQIDIFSNVSQIFSIEKANEDYLLISDSFLEYQELTDLNINAFKKVFYMLQHNYEPNFEKTVKAICDSRDIVMIPSRLVTEQVAELIEKTLNPLLEKTTNVFAFFSSISNVGTTATTLSVGKTLSENTNAKIGILLLNAWDDGTDQLDFKGSYLNDIKSKLTGQLIQTENEFLSLFHMMEKDSLYVLGGNRNTRMERLYSVDEIAFLISMAKQHFDIVLIDCGSHFDNAIIVQSLFESDLRFLIVNQQSKAIKKFNQVFNEALYPLGYKKTDFLMIINQYEDKLHLPSSKDINKEIGVPMLTTIQKNEFGFLSEQEQNLLTSYDDAIYQESINIVAKTVSSKADVEFRHQEVKKKRSIFGR